VALTDLDLWGLPDLDWPVYVLFWLAVLVESGRWGEA